MHRVGGAAGWAVQLFDGGSDPTAFLEVGAVLQLPWTGKKEHILLVRTWRLGCYMYTNLLEPGGGNATCTQLHNYTRTNRNRAKRSL